MTFEQYHRICYEAEKRWDEYISMKGDFNQNESRKEDHLNYWVAVVAAEWKSGKAK